MPIKKNKITQSQINESLLGYIIRTDARIMAFQVTLGKSLGLDKKQKEKLNKIQEENFKFIYQKMLEDAEKHDPGLAARLLDGQDIYSGFV